MTGSDGRLTVSMVYERFFTVGRPFIGRWYTVRRPFVDRSYLKNERFSYRSLTV